MVIVICHGPQIMGLCGCDNYCLRNYPAPEYSPMGTIHGRGAQYLTHQTLYGHSMTLVSALSLYRRRTKVSSLARSTPSRSSCWPFPIATSNHTVRSVLPIASRFLASSGC